MQRELPKVYAQKVDHDTNRSVAYTKSEEKKEIRKTDFKIEKSVEEKIREIFNNVNYVYKIEVVIETNEGKVTKYLVGRNKENIITMDNEQIPIKDIKDIYIK
jgi:hypothetical protein